MRNLGRHTRHDDVTLNTHYFRVSRLTQCDKSVRAMGARKRTIPPHREHTSNSSDAASSANCLRSVSYSRSNLSRGTRRTLRGAYVFRSQYVCVVLTPTCHSAVSSVCRVFLTPAELRVCRIHTFECQRHLVFCFSFSRHDLRLVLPRATSAGWSGVGAPLPPSLCRW